MLKISWFRLGKTRRGADPGLPPAAEGPEEEEGEEEGEEGPMADLQCCSAVVKLRPLLYHAALGRAAGKHDGPVARGLGGLLQLTRSC